VVEAAELVELDGAPGRSWLHRARLRTVHGKAEMSATLVIVSEIVGKNAPKMTFAEEHDVVEAVPAYASDRRFDIWILPRIIRNRDD
jgi:hypothetical protein